MNQDKKVLKQMRWKLFLMGLFKIPMLGRLRPKLIQIDDNTILLKIKLNRISKNHLNSMYFGALAVGADCAAGLHAFYFAEKYHKKISFAFKSIRGEFLKRAESDVTFCFSKGKLIEDAVCKSMETKERYQQICQVEAFNDEKELVAFFEMEASIKVID